MVTIALSNYSDEYISALEGLKEYLISNDNNIHIIEKRVPIKISITDIGRNDLGEILNLNDEIKINGVYSWSTNNIVIDATINNDGKNNHFYLKGNGDLYAKVNHDSGLIHKLVLEAIIKYDKKNGKLYTFPKENSLKEWQALTPKYLIVENPKGLDIYVFEQNMFIQFLKEYAIQKVNYELVQGKNIPDLSE